MKKNKEVDMKKIVVINCSPRINMNTGTLVREAAKCAEAEGTDRCGWQYESHDCGRYAAGQGLQPV